MLVLSMDSKRQRRPNVRLGEIGDVSAAFSCGFSQKNKNNLGHRRWKHDFMNPKETDRYFPNCEFTILESGVSPRSADMQQNRENKNPNSLKSASEFASLDGNNMAESNLNFGTITRKCRVMNRRGRSEYGNNNGFRSAWSFKVSPEFNREDGKECGGKNFIGFNSNEFDDLYPVDDFKDFSYHENSSMSKDVFENDIDEHTHDTWKRGNSNDYWKEDARYEGNDPKYGGGWDKFRFKGSDVNSVMSWLEEMGLGKYAGLFKMHEVDEEALPLLTIEDLKEMGVLAVGPRRKLYTAIQQLRDSGVSALQTTEHNI